MLYRPSLENLLAQVKGAQAALLLDSEGEVVVAAGDPQPRHRLIGAYEGISLATLNKIVERHKMGGLEYVARRHAGGSVILRPLKDGYYLIVSLGPEATLAEAVHRSASTRDLLNQDL
jgi:predicted regulator of Ras-like GTPase activity (Roadblock/LC7/MglB family)